MKMKKNDLTSLRVKTVKELGKSLSDKRKELAKVSVAIVAGTEKKLKKAKNLRKDIAQLATIIKEKEIMEMIKKSEGDKKE